MHIPSMFVFTHDSIGVGEDGPTHQPIEHLASLRAIPNLLVIRPADANEVTEAYKIALTSRKTPSILVFTRQNLPTIDRERFAAADNVAKGGYVLADCPDHKPSVILIGTGSEVGLCLSAWEKLTSEGIKARVVSLPCWELFERQTPEYKESVLPTHVHARVGVELGVEQGWSKYVGPQGCFLGMNDFGASAPAGVLMKHFGFTVENLCDLAKKTLKAVEN
jgi:transketolase